MKNYIIPASKDPSRYSRLRNTLLAAAVFASYLASSSVTNAVPIVGGITFNGSVTFNAPPPGASAVTAWISPVVFADTGTFSVIPPGTPGAFSAPYTFNPSTVVSPLWTVSSGGVTFTFNLLNTTSLFETAGNVLTSGTGFLTGTGFDPTPATWVFTAFAFGDRGVNTPGSSGFTFFGTVTSGIPEGGASSCLLLGLGCGGSLLMHRTFRRQRKSIP